MPKLNPALFKPLKRIEEDFRRSKSAAAKTGKPGFDNLCWDSWGTG
jgi:hypothetical protein